MVEIKEKPPIKKIEEPEKAPIIEKEQIEALKPREIKKAPPKKIIKSYPITVGKQAATIQGLKRQRQVKILTDLALEKGVHHAVAVAKKLDSAYVLDEFHDTLVDELYAELKKRGKLESV